MSKDEMELQQKFMEYQMLEQQIKQLQEQMQAISEQMLEIEYIKKALADISSVEADKEIMCPLSSGIFVKAKITEPGTFYMNVGNSVVTKKDLDGATKLMDSQEKEMVGTQEKIHERIEQCSLQVNEIQDALMKATKG